MSDQKNLKILIALQYYVPHRTGLTLHGIWHWNLADAPDMMRMIGRVGEKLDVAITHRFALDRIEEAWKLQMTGQCGKVIIKPFGGA